MITLELTHNNNITEYNIPNSWEDITVEKFQKLANTEYEEGMNDIEQLIRNISVLTDIPEENLYKFTSSNFKLIADNFLFLTTEIKDDFKDEIQIGGETYYVKKEFKELTLGEEITINVILEKSEGNIMRCMDLLLTLFLRKKVNDELEEYDTRFKSRVELFKDIKITDIYNLFGFFLGLKKP